VILEKPDIRNLYFVIGKLNKENEKTDSRDERLKCF
jgi:hypothetical protein